MQDDFDNGMGLPDDELGGGSTMSDPGEHGAGHEGEAEPTSAPAGRPSGGARAHKSSARKSSAARKTSRGGKKKRGGARKVAKKKGGARKRSKKTARRKAGRKK